jgi:hypothetical protein
LRQMLAADECGPSVLIERDLHRQP